MLTPPVSRRAPRRAALPLRVCHSRLSPAAKKPFKRLVAAPLVRGGELPTGFCLPTFMAGDVSFTGATFMSQHIKLLSFFAFFSFRFHFSFALSHPRFSFALNVNAEKEKNKTSWAQVGGE